MTKTDRYVIWAVLGKKVRAPRRVRTNHRGPARNWKYRAWIRSLPSIVSGQLCCEAAHTGNDGGMAQKASDYSCVPLTTEEHREYHRVGRTEFEQANGIDFAAITRDLTHAWFAHSKEIK